jgi:hypothetical protein
MMFMQTDGVWKTYQNGRGVTERKLSNTPRLLAHAAVAVALPGGGAKPVLIASWRMTEKIRAHPAKPWLGALPFA